MRRAALLLVVVFCTACAAYGEEPTSTLAHVRAAGNLRCGVDAEVAEYSTDDDHGNRAAFDADLCRAVALAVLGDKAKFSVKAYPDDAAAAAALRSGEADLLPTLTNDFTHSVETDLASTRPVLWDGVGFLVLAGNHAAHARQLNGKKICFLAETNIEETVRAWFLHEHLDFVPFPFQEEGEMQAAFATGNCGALAGQRTRLAQNRAALTQRATPARLLPEAISADPLAATVRDNDAQWQKIVNWVMEALVAAEELGVTQANALELGKQAADDHDPQRRFLLGGSHQVGTALGLDDNWVTRVIAATGNYGEIYTRDLGSGSALKLPRGNNKLRRKGGVLLAIPMR